MKHETLIDDYKRTVDRKLLPKLEKIQSELTILREEWEVIKNPKLVRKIEESIIQKRKGRLHSWEEFKKIVDEK